MRRTAKSPKYTLPNKDSHDPVAEMARIRVSHALTGPDAQANVEQTIRDLMQESLNENPTAWSEATHQVMRGVMEALKNEENSTEKIRNAAETAVLEVARRWGNVVSAGKASVAAAREVAGASGLDSTLLSQQAGLGAMEGALQAGPICYPVLQQELTPMVEDFSNVMKTQRKSFYCYNDDIETSSAVLEWSQLLDSSRAELTPTAVTTEVAPPVVVDESEHEEIRSETEVQESAPLMEIANQLSADSGLVQVGPSEVKVKSAPVESPQSTAKQPVKAGTEAVVEKTAAKPGFVARVVGWFKGLFGKA